MRDYADWLNREPAGPKPKKPLPRSTKRIASVGAKGKRVAGGYRKAVLAHLSEFPKCQIGPIIKAAGFDVLCLDTATHVHHPKGRGKHLCGPLMSACNGECHLQWTHKTHVAEAYALGILLPK